MPTDRAAGVRLKAAIVYWLDCRAACSIRAAFRPWVREHLDAAISLDVVADALATTARTSTRRLNAMLGKTPIEYIQDLRIERAVHLLKTTKLTVDRIAEQVGYADGHTLRTLLRRRIGKGVRELRAS